jgi:hypothetical protein
MDPRVSLRSPEDDEAERGWRGGLRRALSGGGVVSHCKGTAMTDAETRAFAAKRLLEDPLLVQAFETISRNAMSGLVTVDADDRTAVLRLQAKAQVIDEIISELESAILAAVPQEQQAVS